MLTFREGLLPNAIPLPLTACTILAGVAGDGKPLSSTSSGIPPFSFSCELDGPIASLLGTGVMFLTAVFLKAGFLTGTLGFAIALRPLGSDLVVQVPPDELGVPLVGAFEKKLRIDPFLEPALDVCFFNVDGGARAGVASVDSFFLTMMAVDCRLDRSLIKIRDEREQSPSKIRSGQERMSKSKGWLERVKDAWGSREVAFGPCTSQFSVDPCDINPFLTKLRLMSKHTTSSDLEIR
jgi:hypothetical protein